MSCCNQVVCRDCLIQYKKRKLHMLESGKQVPCPKCTMPLSVALNSTHYAIQEARFVVNKLLTKVQNSEFISRHNQEIEKKKETAIAHATASYEEEIRKLTVEYNKDIQDIKASYKNHYINPLFQSRIETFQNVLSDPDITRELARAIKTNINKITSAHNIESQSESETEEESQSSEPRRIIEYDESDDDEPETMLLESDIE